MPITILEKKVPSSDGIHELWGKVYLPENPPRGYVHVVHGMTEHIRRYDDILRAFAEAGYLAFGYDHLGHGYTARNEQELGFIAKKGGWESLVSDVGVYAAAVREEYPLPENAPYILMGHSMGSFIVRMAVARGLRPAKLIIMGTGGKNPAAPIGLAVIRCLKLFRGARAYSPMVDKLAFGSYNKHFRGEGDPRSWLTRDEAHRAKYASDPYCTFHFSLSAMDDLVTLNKRANARAWFRAIPCDLPILLVSGDEDPVGAYGRGVREVARRLEKTGHTVTLRLYPGARHEILNDTCADEVKADIFAFLNA